MAITLDGTTGITTPGLTNTGTETLVNLTTTGNTTLGDATTDTLTVGVTGIVKDASGNVGIGTSSPAYKLDVSGDAIRIQKSVNPIYYAYDTRDIANAGGYWQFQSNGGGSGTVQAYMAMAQQTTSSQGGYMIFATNGGSGATERMRIDSSGNVGIGTSSPSAKLQVAGDITMTGTAWTAYTPTITSGSGSFTTVSATGTYKVFGKTCWFTVAITITTVGTAGGFIGVSLPFTQAASSLSSYGMEVNSTGSMVKGLNPASGVMQVTRYDNATIIGAGYLVRLTGTYETT